MADELLMYHNQVKKNLNCPKTMRKKFLADAKRMTDNFLAENPEASLDELRSSVGEPEELAAMFLDSADSEAVASYRKRKSWAKRAAVILLALAFVAVCKQSSKKGQISPRSIPDKGRFFATKYTSGRS